MIVFGLPVLIGLLLSCSTVDAPPDPSDEPYFQRGEYGGDPLHGTEWLVNIRPSPDETKFALVRRFTPGEPFQPRNQLWLVDADGRNPELIGWGPGTVDWSPDGTRLAVTVRQGIDSFIKTYDLETRQVQQWTGLEHQLISGGTASNPVWFQDGRRLLVSVYGKAYQQPFERGTYIIDTETGGTIGPLLELMESAFLGNGDRYATGRKYSRDPDFRDGNYVLYDFGKDEWEWITSYAPESVRWISSGPAPNPEGTEIVFRKRIENAEQLFIMNSIGSTSAQLTNLGGDNPRWSLGGTYFTFIRDVHKGPGARYVPFRFNLDAMTEEVLWPHLTDSVPAFPPLATQDPVDFFNR